MSNQCLIRHPSTPFLSYRQAASRGPVAVRRLVVVAVALRNTPGHPQRGSAVSSGDGGRARGVKRARRWPCQATFWRGRERRAATTRRTSAARSGAEPAAPRGPAIGDWGPAAIESSRSQALVPPDPTRLVAGCWSTRRLVLFGRPHRSRFRTPLAHGNRGGGASSSQAGE
eukprot:scaffold507_cov391-Prasinococcus_capsulatus_cf.AAC.7